MITINSRRRHPEPPLGMRDLLLPWYLRLHRCLLPLRSEISNLKFEISDAVDFADAPAFPATFSAPSQAAESKLLKSPHKLRRP